MVEPGLDMHEWQTRWAELQELAAEEPEQTLPELVRFARQLLEERGFDLDNPVVLEAEDSELVRDFTAAADIAARIEAGAAAEAEDVQTALDDVRELYEYVVSDRSAP